MSLVRSAFARREILSLPIVGAALSIPRRIQAVEPGKPSRTAIAVAAARAIGSRNPDPKTRNPDHFAAKLLTTQDVECIKGLAEYDAFSMNWPEVVEYSRKQWGGMIANHPGVLPFVGVNLRTRHLDAAVLAAMENGTEQIVILGAGLDSRAYRLTASWDGGRVFEIDFPATQEYKKQKIVNVIGVPPKNLSYVPIDFTQNSLEEVLPSRGYRSGSRTLFIWEGVTMYLPKVAIQRTLAFVARHAGPGSSIIFDYQDERTISKDCDDEVWRKWAELSAKWGEPWMFGIPDTGKGNVFQFVAEQGLEVKTDFTMGELCVKHLPSTIMPAAFGFDRWAWRICQATQKRNA